MDADEVSTEDIETPKGPPADIDTRIVERDDEPEREVIEGDICVLGAGISGVTAALTAAGQGRDVILVDAQPSIGGNAVNSIVGTIIGLYDHQEDPERLTYGVSKTLTDELVEEGSMVEVTGLSTIYIYDEVRLGRWMERKVEENGINTLLGSVLTDVAFGDRHIQHIDCVNRFGSVRIDADAWVDASGDGALTWEAGLEMREPVAPVYGTLSFTIEDYDTEAADDLVIDQVHERISEVGDQYGLEREDGQLVHHENADFMVANLNHIETPLDPLSYADMVFEGRRQADNIIEFLNAEFPEIFEGASVRSYGDIGIRQTRWIKGRRQLTVEELRSGERPDDAIGRSAWWVELHDRQEGFRFEQFDRDHVYYIPLSCMIPEGADNVVATGRCVDADTKALSAIRVMGPCMAMGTAAAHALDLAGTDPVYDVDIDELQYRLRRNLGDEK